jgi:hypothetical protein
MNEFQEPRGDGIHFVVLLLHSRIDHPFLPTLSRHEKKEGDANTQKTFCGTQQTSFTNTVLHFTGFNGSQSPLKIGANWTLYSHRPHITNNG